MNNTLICKTVFEEEHFFFAVFFKRIFTEAGKYVILSVVPKRELKRLKSLIIAAKKRIRIT